MFIMNPTKTNKVMIRETYVLFETAKLAEDKGFKASTETGYSSNGEVYLHQGGQESVSTGGKYYEGRDYRGKDFLCTRPTQALLQKWLWEIHGFWVEMTLWGGGMGFVCLIKQAKGKEIDGSTIVRQVGIVDSGFERDPYKILEKGIQTALKLIE